MRKLLDLPPEAGPEDAYKAMENGVLRLFHGGAKGRKPGDILLPAKARSEGYQSWHPNEEHKALVWITADRMNARTYAVIREPRGWVYEVEPLGSVTPERGVWNLNVGTPKARVVRVFERKVEYIHGYSVDRYIRLQRTLCPDVEWPTG